MYRLIFLFLTCSLPVRAQSDSLQIADTLFYKCGFSSAFSGRSVAESGDDLNAEEQDIFTREFRTLFEHINSFPPVYKVKRSTLHDSYAWVSLVRSNNSEVMPYKLALYYNPDSIANVIRRYGVSFELWGIIIHEIGHMIRQDPFYKQESVKAESTADRYLGFQARRLFGTTAGATAAIEKLVSKDYDGYPTKQQRIRLVLEGWNNADPLRIRLNSPVLAFVNQETEFNPARRIKRNNEFKKILQADTSWHLASIDKFPTGKFYVTPQETLVFEDNNGVLTIGRITPSLREGFQYIVMDDYFQQLFIDEAGRIYSFQNDQKKLVAILTNNAAINSDD